VEVFKHASTRALSFKRNREMMNGREDKNWDYERTDSNGVI
jgi:hypothetical protein